MSEHINCRPMVSGAREPVEQPGGPDTPILHVDMDCFFAAVEVADRPELFGIPVVVGGTGSRGVVAACSYEARVFGIRSAMPTSRARQLCPQAVFLSGRYSRYEQVSEEFRGVLMAYTPLVETISLDEAFLDVSGCRRLFGDGPEIARRLRSEIRSVTGLEACIGVARTKFLAKLGSRAAKPRFSRSGVRTGPGVVVVEPDGELDFLHPMSVGALWGVGPATLGSLRKIGVETVGDLARVPLASLVGALGPAAGHQLHELAWARDPRRVEPFLPPKSIGHEETYATDITDRTVLDREFVRLSDAVAQRLSAAALACRTVTIKVRNTGFETVSRSETVPDPLVGGHAISAVAKRLAAQVEMGDGVRLAGVSASHFLPANIAGTQLSFDLAPTQREGGVTRDPGGVKIAAAVAAIRQRFGNRAVGAASLVSPEGLAMKRRGDTQWGPSEETWTD